ncbi:MAG: 4Fe-4S binding protein [Deltaproteobacteria bacterium]|nr:4Fe-4S binding protein [Deltaproteobacteria bacterium]
MNWSSEADAAMKKVPFFVRKRVRTRVEKEAEEAGKKTVTLAEVKATQKRYLQRMSDEIRGYQVETCFGPQGCPNRAVEGDGLVQRLEDILKKANLRTFLEEHVVGDLKHHHEFRVSAADCPNACSQPQIKDMGIIGAAEPMLTDEECTLCEVCVEACKEDAITLDEAKELPVIDYDRCLMCGQCIKECPTGTIAAGRTGYRVLLGGKLGRHPRLAEELQGLYSEEEVVEILKQCIAFYKKKSKRGERFSTVYWKARDKKEIPVPPLERAGDS